MNNKSAIKIFFIFIFFPIFIFSIILYISDPLQLFHKQSNSTYLEPNARYQVAGLINYYKFDSIILGSSMLENTSAKESSQKLGGNFMNFSLSGSDFHTRALILNYLFRYKKIDKIIYSLDNNGLVDATISDTSNFDFLYDENKFNDMKVYINKKYLLCSINKSYCQMDVNLDRPNAWYMVEDYKKRFGGLDRWFQINNNRQIKDAFKLILNNIKQIKLGNINRSKNLIYDIEKAQQYINDNIINFVSKHPDTDFILIVPPYSRIFYAIEAQYNISKFEVYKSSIKYLVSQSQKYPNLKIYAWGNYAFIDNIANYKDLSHYEYKINSFMLDAITKKEGLLTTENIDQYLNIFTKKALEYNLLVFGNKIKQYLDEQKK